MPSSLSMPARRLRTLFRECPRKKGDFREMLSKSRSQLAAERMMKNCNSTAVLLDDIGTCWSPTTNSSGSYQSSPAPSSQSSSTNLFIPVPAIQPSRLSSRQSLELEERNAATAPVHTNCGRLEISSAEFNAPNRAHRKREVLPTLPVEKQILARNEEKLQPQKRPKLDVGVDGEQIDGRLEPVSTMTAGGDDRHSHDSNGDPVHRSPSPSFTFSPNTAKLDEFFSF